MRNKKYLNIEFKLAGVIGMIMIVFVLVFSSYIYGTMRKNAMNRYRQETNQYINNIGDNINYYIDNLIMAAKSVYINHPIIDLLESKQDIDVGQIIDIQKNLVEYFKSIYYSTPNVAQMYLVVPERDLAILYLPRQLGFVNGTMSEIITIPELKDCYDVYVESTHPKTDYGLNIPPMNQYPMGEDVFTIWLPISNLPTDKTPFAYLAIDISISFIITKCQFTSNYANETAYIVDENNFIIASDDEYSTRLQFDQLYPNYAKQIAESKENGSNYCEIADDEMMIFSDAISSEYMNWTMIKMTSSTNIYALTKTQTISMNVLFTILVIIVLLISIGSIHHYTSVLHKITNYMEEILENKNWETVRSISSIIPYKSNDEISSLLVTFDLMMASMHEHAIQKYEWELTFVKAEMRTMQAQINPHFIYNVIQCFATNSLKDHNLQQYRMISSFGQMLHYAMVLDPSIVAVSKELEYIDRYIGLQNMRFGRQLIIQYVVDATVKDFKIPKMTIQPLVENAIVHGKLMKKEDGTIKIEINSDEKLFNVLVEDNGIEISEQTIYIINQKIESIRFNFSGGKMSKEQKRVASVEAAVNQDEHHNNFIGMENVFARLFLYYGDCQMSIYANELGGTSIRFAVPIKAEPYQEVLRENVNS